MQMNLENDNVLNTVKSINKELTLEKDLDSMKEQFNKIVGNTFDKMVKYTIKAMPIPDGFKDVLNDVKDAFKTKDFKTIVKTAISSSVREGLEILGLDKASIKSFKTLAETAMKGGLSEGIKAGIDMVAKKYLKNNIVGSYIYDFFKQVKDLPYTKAFTDKLSKAVSKFDNLKNEILEKCKSFKEAYLSFDVEKMKKLSEDIIEKSKTLKNDNECIREVKTIQNINKLVSIKNEKLTDEQLNLCSMM